MGLPTRGKTPRNISCFFIDRFFTIRYFIFGPQTACDYIFFDKNQFESNVFWLRLTHSTMCHKSTTTLFIIGSAFLLSNLIMDTNTDI